MIAAKHLNLKHNEDCGSVFNKNCFVCAMSAKSGANIYVLVSSQMLDLRTRQV